MSLMPVRELTAVSHDSEDLVDPLLPLRTAGARGTVR